MDDEMNHKTPDFCRCCLLENADDVDLIEMKSNYFEYNGEPVGFLDGFETCCGVRYIKIPGIDENPKICNLCTVQLESSYVFQALYTEANKALVEKYIPSVFSMKSLEPEEIDAKSEEITRSMRKRTHVNYLPQGFTEKRQRNKSPTPINQNDEIPVEKKLKIIKVADKLGRNRRLNESSQRVIKCATCNQLVTNINKHKLLSHPEVAGVYRCTLKNCSKVYTVAASLAYHLNAKHTKNCLKCQASFQSESGLAKHEKAVHRIQPTLISTPTSTSTTIATPLANSSATFKCPMCDFSTEHLKNLKIHYANKHKQKLPDPSIMKQVAPMEHKKENSSFVEETFKCQLCKFHTTFRKGYKIHMYVKHDTKIGNDGSKEQPIVKSFKCKQCAFESATMKGYKLHLFARHRMIVQKNLNVAPKIQKKKYKEIIKTATATKPIVYKCQKCFASFPTFRGLQQHISHAHSARKKRKSHIFKGKATRKRRLHKCEVCMKTFDTLNGRWTHSFEHKDIWPFHCSECDEQHIRKESFVNHLKNDHNIEYNPDIHMIYNAHNR